MKQTNKTVRRCDDKRIIGQMPLGEVTGMRRLNIFKEFKSYKYFRCFSV